MQAAADQWKVKPGDCKVDKGVVTGPGGKRATFGQLADAADTIHRRGGFLCGLHPDIIRVAEEPGHERVAISSAVVPVDAVLDDLRAKFASGNAQMAERLGLPLARYGYAVPAT